MKLFENEADTARGDAREAREELELVREELAATKKMMDSMM